MLKLVTDRTIDDVIARNEKGTYNANTLNRVENATLYIAELLTANGYPTTIQIKNDWKEDKESNYTTDEDRKSNWNSLEKMTRYLDNVKFCVTQFIKSDYIPNLPETINGLTFEDANTIEKTLENIEFLVGNMKKEYIYAGTFSAGEGVVL